MNAKSSFALRSWLYLLLFQIACFGLCVLLSVILASLGVWNPAFVESGGVLKVAGVFFCFWAVLSSIALFEYKIGIDPGNAIPCMAIIASPVSAAVFLVLWQVKHPSLPFAGAVGLGAVLSAMAGLALSYLLIAFAQSVEKKIYPLFQKMGL